MLRSAKRKFYVFKLEQNVNNAKGTWKIIDHFTVVCLVAEPLNESEAGVDLALIEASQLFLCKFLLISMTTTSLTSEKQ